MADQNTPSGTTADAGALEGHSTSGGGNDRAPARQENPRTRGFSPARDLREAQSAPQEERMVRIRDSDHSEQAVVDALAFKAEQEVRKNTLPKTKDDYQVKLPPNFKAPEGVKFEFDLTDPGLEHFRQLAHARGMDQETFSDSLGVYAANKIAEQQRLAPARAAELSKLGSAAENRIGAVETWLKARAGNKADGLVAQMRQFPVAAMVETFEEIMNQFSRQGGVDFDQRGRAHEQQKRSSIPEFTGNNFVQVRTAQTAEMLRNNPAMANRARQK